MAYSVFLIRSASRAGSEGLAPQARRLRGAAALPIVVALLFVLGVAHSAVAATTFYTDEAAWIVAVDSVAVDSLDTAATNVVFADEVVSTPTSDTQLGPQLTFRVGNTGLCGSFTLKPLEPGAGLTYDDVEQGPPFSFPPGTLSIGDIDSFEDDDFRIAFSTPSIFAVGFFLVDNTQEAGESFSAFGSSGVLGTLDGASIPDSSGNGSTFVGVVASEPLTSVRFDEDPGNDDVAIRDFRLGCAVEDPDADGLSNLSEHAVGTDLDDADTDDDGLLDGEEAGTGSFGPQQVFSQVPGSRPTSVAAADLDGDGDMDLAATLEKADKTVWFENTDGAFSFGAQHAISILAESPIEVVASDLDGDGDQDVLSISRGLFDLTIAWYENTDGAGSFGPEEVIAALVQQPAGVFSADLDGDGDMDVLAALSGFAPKFAWYENTDGAGTFGAEQVISILIDIARDVFAAEVDGDGDLDVVSCSNDKIAWYENTNGAGAFGPQQVISILPGRFKTVFAADLDGDGDMDVVSSSITHGLVWYENTDGEGSFGAPLVISLGGDAPSVIASDVDGDGDIDVLAASPSGVIMDDEITWYENTDGAGSFGPKQVISSLIDGGAASVFVADLDGDGDKDVISTSGLDDKIAWYEQLGTNPTDPDSDDDGLLDGFEVANGFDPLVPGEQNGDPDGDGLSNLGEQAAGTDPNNADTDGDGVNDLIEIQLGTDPTDPLSFPVQLPTLGPWGAGLLAVLLSVLGTGWLRRRTPRRRAGMGTRSPSAFG